MELRRYFPLLFGHYRVVILAKMAVFRLFSIGVCSQPLAGQKNPHATCINGNCCHWRVSNSHD